MPKEQPHICRTCFHAKWEDLTATGRPKKKAFGECAFPVDPSKIVISGSLPAACTVTAKKTWIRPENEIECPCWQAKNG